jgi:alpha-L-rhamnosidase
LRDFTGRVATSAIRDIGDIHTDDPLINQLFSNVRWGQRGNYLWVPTDCPQRDERQGWTGDAQLFSNTALYNGDVDNFLEAFQDMLIDSQESYGDSGAEFPPVAPGGFNAIFTDVGVSGWADAGVIIPWTVWQMTGDDTIVGRSWTAMTKYMDWVAQRGLGPFGGQGTITGDWLAFQRSTMNFMSDVYYGYSASLMAQMARATGRTADAAKYEQLLANIRTAFIAKYVKPDPINGVRVMSSLGLNSPLEVAFGGNPTYKAEDDGQTALLWVLKLGFYEGEEQRQAIVDLLADNIENTATYQQTHPTTSRADFAPETLSVGFLGVNVLAPVLTDNGRTDLAYTLLHQDEMPSWLYSVKNGATTVWERWNSYSKENGFGDVNMNSFNHYSYGAVAEWMYEYMAGIAKDTRRPGFEHFYLQPHIDPTGKITEVHGTFESPFGKILSSWSRNGDHLDYRARVPANSTATLRIPAVAPGAVRDAEGRLEDAPGVALIGHAGGVATFRLASGEYEIASILP